MSVPYTLCRRPARGFGALLAASSLTANGCALLEPSGASADPANAHTARAAIAASIHAPLRRLDLTPGNLGARWPGACYQNVAAVQKAAGRLHDDNDPVTSQDRN